MDEKVADLVSVSMNSVSMTVQRIPENNEQGGREGGGGGGEARNTSYSYHMRGCPNLVKCLIRSKYSVAKPLKLQARHNVLNPLSMRGWGNLPSLFSLILHV